MLTLPLSYLLEFVGVRDAVDNFTLANIAIKWMVFSSGNWIGGGIFIGLAYSWLQSKLKHLTLIKETSASKDIHQTRLQSSYSTPILFA